MSTIDYETRSVAGTYAGQLAAAMRLRDLDLFRTRILMLAGGGHGLQGAVCEAAAAYEAYCPGIRCEIAVALDMAR